MHKIKSMRRRTNQPHRKRLKLNLIANLFLVICICFFVYQSISEMILFYQIKNDYTVVISEKNHLDQLYSDFQNQVELLSNDDYYQRVYAKVVTKRLKEGEQMFILSSSNNTEDNDDLLYERKLP